MALSALAASDRSVADELRAPTTFGSLHVALKEARPWVDLCLMRPTLNACGFLAVLVVLPGCQWLWDPAAIGDTDPAAAEQAQADIRGSIPAIEAFYADNGTYAGITVGGLRTTYDPGVPAVRIVVTSPNSYCVESTVSGVTYSKAGPGADIRPGPCRLEDLHSPVALPVAANQLRTVVVVMEAYFARNGTFEGVRVRWLKNMIPGLRPLRIVEAGPQSYCIEMSGEGSTYSARGPTGDVGVGRC
jgi:hypothetical protein